MDQKVQATLNRLHKEANGQKITLVKSLFKAMVGGFKPIHFEDAYISISEKAGKLIYDTIVANHCKKIVEFGTSFGISTLYLAAAAELTGGKVITSELLESKAERARINFKKADLDYLIDLRIGDVMQTFKDIPDQIDFLLLDGWKDLYQPLLMMLEPKLKTGCIVVLDNASMSGVRECYDYMLSSGKYKVLPAENMPDRMNMLIKK